MKRLAFSSLAAVTLLAGCAGGFVPPDPIGRALFGGSTRETVVYAPQEYTVATVMPPPRYERRVVVPRSYGRDAVWVNGQWVWVRNRWAWREGYWTRPPRRGAVYVSGAYYERGPNRYWRSGYWR